MFSWLGLGWRHGWEIEVMLVTGLDVELIFRKVGAGDGW
jgi:hypothetical protein